MTRRQLARVARAVAESGPRATLIAVRAKRRGAKQKLREFAAFVHIVADLEPAVVLEIGSLHGGTLWAWTRLARTDAVIVSVDLPGGAYGGGYPEAHALRLESYARRRQQVRLIRSDSHDQATLQRVLHALDGTPVDLLFIDGDHTYVGVKEDFEMYGDLVRPGGLIAFHDIVPQADSGVDQLWRELKGRKHELVDKTDLVWRGEWGGWGGIGIVSVARE